MRGLAPILAFISVVCAQEEGAALPELTLASLLGQDAGLQSLQSYSVPLASQPQSLQVPPPTNLYSAISALESANGLSNKLAYGNGYGSPRRLGQRRLGGNANRASLFATRGRLLGGSGRQQRLPYNSLPQYNNLVPQYNNLPQYNGIPTSLPSINSLPSTVPILPFNAGQPESLDVARKRQTDRRQWLSLVVERNQLRRVQEIRKLEAEIGRLRNEIATTAAVTSDLAAPANWDAKSNQLENNLTLQSLNNYDFSNLATLAQTAAAGSLKKDEIAGEQ